MHTNAFSHTQTNKLTSHFVLGDSIATLELQALATEEIVNYIPQSRGASVNKKHNCLQGNTLFPVMLGLRRTC